MNRLRILFLFGCMTCCLMAVQVCAQPALLLSQAYRYQAKKQPEKAIALLYKAVKAHPEDQELCSTLGAWLYEEHRFADAAAVWRQGCVSVKNGSRFFSKPLARSLIRSGAAGEALQVLDHNPPSGNDPEWTALKEQAHFVMQARKAADSVFSLGPRINTSDPELFPFLSADSQHFYFTRRMGNSDEDFFYAVPDSCGDWLTARNLGAPPNTPQQEAAQTISADRHYLFFMRCDNKSENGWTGGGCDLYMAYTPDSTWSVPEPFGATINTPAYEGMPCLSPDNRELFFVSNRPGGYGGLDIWVTRFGQGLWQQPHNLGPEVNTAGDETAPFLHADNETLYFASDGHPGFGGSDLFRCRRGTDTLWTQVQNLGAPVNSGYDEASCFVRSDGQRMLFSSDRQGPAGNFDLYGADLPAEERPQPVTFVKGYVYDSVSRERLNYARLSVLLPDSLEPLYEYRSNRGDGSFMMVLRPGTRYLLHCQRMGYLDRTDTLLFPEQAIVVPAEWDIALLPFDYQKPVFDTLVLTLHYRRNMTVLDDTSRQLLVQSMNAYVQDTTATVLVNSYTDNTGTPVLNDQLSDLRARLVAQELEKIGFAAGHIQAQGWAEADPLVSNDTEENRYLNRRVEIVIRR